MLGYRHPFSALKFLDAICDNSSLDLEKHFKIDYPSNCQIATLIQDSRKYSLTAIEKVEKKKEEVCEWDLGQDWTPDWEKQENIKQEKIKIHLRIQEEPKPNPEPLWGLPDYKTDFASIWR